MPSSTVPWSTILESALWAAAAVAVVTLAFAVGVRAMIRAGEHRAAGESLGAGLAGGVGVVAFGVAAAAVVIGLVLFTRS